MQSDYSKITVEDLLNTDIQQLSEQDRNRLIELLYSICSAIEDGEPDLYTQLVEIYGGTYDEWIDVNCDIDSGTGTDFWVKNIRTGQVIYINLEADGSYTFEETTTIVN